MRRPEIVICLGLAAFATGVAAQNFPTPARKSGLWKQTIVSSPAGKPAQTMTSTLCVDPSVDKVATAFGSGMGQQACSSNTVTKTPAGYSFASVCNMGAAGTVRSQGTASGDFSRAYKVSMKSTTTGAAMAQMNGASSTNITAAWSGACPAGQRPGDMVMPGGMKINVLAAMKAAGR